MDRADLRILSCLMEDVFLTDEGLGRRVGLTGKAVRLRRRRLENQGVLTEYGVHPRPEILGRHAFSWGYVGRVRAELPIAELSEVDDLAYVRSFRPNFHAAVRFSRASGASAHPRLARLLGRPMEGPLDERAPKALLDPDRLSRRDWSVLEAVTLDPRAPYSRQARGAGVSPRAFRARRRRLEAANVLASSMILDLAREEGLATYGLWLKVDDTFDPRALEMPRLWDQPHWTRTPRGVYLLGSGYNYVEARELELHLRGLPGVTSVEPMVPAGGYFARARVLDWIRTERLRRFPRSLTA